MSSENIALYINGLSGSVRNGLAGRLESLTAKMPVHVFVPSSLDEGRDIITDVLEKRYRAIAIVGGDGTISTVYEMMLGTNQDSSTLPPLALFKGGTGNGLHESVGADRKYRRDLDRLVACEAFPTISFPILEVVATDSDGEEHVAYHTFAGAGSDARVLKDFAEFKRGHPTFPNFASYLTAIFGTSLWRERKFDHPRFEMYSQSNVVQVECTSEGTRKMRGVVAEGDLMSLLSLDQRDFMSVAIGTSPHYGFGWKALPAAPYATKERKMHVRLVGSTPGELAKHFILHPGRTWAGVYPERMVDFVMSDVEFRYERAQQMHVAGTPLVEAVKMKAHVTDHDIKLVDYAQL